MNIHKVTAKYETWLAKHVQIVPADLDFKHEQMRSGVFPFFRATFYRWVHLFGREASTQPDALEVLAVGDLHVENYGTWRDAEGRLVWGVNDFDEAAYMPYTNDLVRLATSVELAVSAGHLKLDAQSACETILDGYRESLEARGRPFVLEGEHDWLRHLATGAERAPDRFWAGMTALPKVKTPPLAAGLAAIESAFPRSPGPVEIKARRAGLGSLGHPRYVAIAEHEGGKLAREAKLLAPSAVLWASKAAAKEPGEMLYGAIVGHAVRCQDPFLSLHGMWLVRRLAPICTRIELSMLPAERDELKMVHAMAFELGNIHLASPHQIPKVLAHLGDQPKKWFHKASAKLADLVSEDFETYRKGT